MAFARKDLGSSDWSPQGSGNGFAVGNPLALTSIQEHWRAQNIAAGAVSSWAGRNGKCTISQANASQQPVNTASQINGKAAVIFDGTDDFLDSGASAIVIPQPWEFWILYKRIAFVAADFLFELGNTTLTDYMQDFGTTTAKGAFGSTFYTMTVPAVGTWTLMRISSGIGASASSVTVNNGASNTWGTPTAGTDNNSAQRLALACKADGTLNPNIAVADMFFTNAQLSANEVTFVLNYYRNYYGLTL